MNIKHVPSVVLVTLRLAQCLSLGTEEGGCLRGGDHCSPGSANTTVVKQMMVRFDGAPCGLPHAPPVATGCPAMKCEVM